MKIDFNKSLLNLNREQMHEVRNEDSGAPCPTCKRPFRQVRVPLTLASMVVDALLTPEEGERISGSEKVRRFELAQKVHDGRTEFISDEIVLIKQQAEKMLHPLPCGQVLALIEEAEKPKQRPRKGSK